MKKSYMRELILVILIIIFFMIFMVEALKSWNNNTIGFGISGVILIILMILFLVNYIMKIIKVNDKKLKLLWLNTPIIGIVLSCILVNGINSTEYRIINLISCFSVFLIIILNNIYIYYYCGLKSKSTITIILYNIISIIACINGAGIYYMHHYYLAMLVFAIPISITEMLIKTKLKNITME